MPKVETFVELENPTGIVQSVYTQDGIRHVMMPYSTRAWPTDIAEKFLETRAGFVRAGSLNNFPPILPGDKICWVANMTGNPFVESEFKQKVTKRISTPAGVVSQEVEEVIPNPVSKPTALKWKLQTGQGKDSYGRIRGVAPDDDFNLPPFDMVLRPYTRAPVSQDTAQWILQRDALQGQIGYGKVIECREPTSFEPTMAWPIDQMLFYAQMVDLHAFNKDIVDEIFCKNDPYFANRKRAPKMSEIVAEKNTEAAIKLAVMNRLFFRIVDPMFTLPSDVAFKKAWDDFKTETK